jgi:DNA repair protein RadA/Sms
MSRPKTVYVCRDCGYKASRWMGRCPGCDECNSLEEQRDVHGKAQSWAVQPNAAQAITAIEAAATRRASTGVDEFDRVLGGGVVPGSLVLVGGDPGVGKSTLLLQVSHQWAAQFGTVLYISGEESPQQLKLRAERLNALHPRLLILSETDMGQILAQIRQNLPQFVVVDSIQTVFSAELASAPGSVSQVRDAAASFLALAKSTGTSIVLVGHVTKAGALAGPRVLEHMVDVVCYFEGDPNTQLRILRAVKNRFGSTNEVGIFQMGQGGLAGIPDPSSVFLAGRPRLVPGSVVFPSCEGSRILLVELQALVTPAPFGGPPRRLASGIDYNRMCMLLAVLEKRRGLGLHSHDVYCNVAGGLRIAEPAADLGIALAVASSFRNQAPVEGLVAFGEVGLAGEVRGIARVEARIKEGIRLGFNRFLLPRTESQDLKKLAGEGISLLEAASLEEALELALP